MGSTFSFATRVSHFKWGLKLSVCGSSPEIPPAACGARTKISPLFASIHYLELHCETLSRRARANSCLLTILFTEIFATTEPYSHCTTLPTIIFLKSQRHCFYESLFVQLHIWFNVILYCMHTLL